MTGPTAPLIVWDLDEVLADMRTLMCERLNPLYGTATHHSTWSDHEFHVFFGAFNHQLYIRRLVETRIMEDCLPEPGVADVLSSLQAAGWRQVIVTARGWHPRAAEVTCEWLNRHGLGRCIDDVVIVDPWASKLGALRGLGVATLYVEDNPRHALAAAENGLAATTLLLDRPWNRSTAAAPGVTRIATTRAVQLLTGTHTPGPGGVAAHR